MPKYQNSLVKSSKSQPFSNSRIVNKQLIFSWIKMHHLKLSFVLSWKTLKNLKLHSLMYQKTADTFAGFVVDDPVILPNYGKFDCHKMKIWEFLTLSNVEIYPKTKIPYLQNGYNFSFISPNCQIWFHIKTWVSKSENCKVVCPGLYWKC